MVAAADSSRRRVADAGVWVPRLAFARDTVLGSYAQILFSRSPWVGLVLLAATALSPRSAIFGLAAVVLAALTAGALRYSPQLTRSGLFGYNALLVGLGGASLVEPSPMGFGLLAVAVAGSVMVTAAVHSALGQGFALPALTIPFLLVFYLVLGAAPLADIPLRSLSHDTVAIQLGVPAAPRLYLQSLGALFFLPRVDVGAVVLMALLLHTRIGTLLSMLAFSLVAVIASDLFVLSDPTLAIMLGYNCVLTGIALGGVWFVPSVWSFLLAGSGVLMTGLFTLGSLPRMSLGGLPLLILPFNLTVILILYAMRQRMRDGRPKAVDFMIGTPEQNLHYFRTRLARFGASYWVRFSAPFRGKWIITQGIDGEITHRGPWSDALDFQVTGPDGELHSGDGSRLTDHHCYRLPVLAAAPGVVVRTVDGVADTPIGQVNTKENWGNLVLIHHAPGLFSLVCHLAPGSLKVREGQAVTRGELLAMAGSSGRSPYPHLHFQLQATAVVGAPTVPLELHDVVRVTPDEEVLEGVCVPAKGDTIRNLDPDPEIGRRLQFEYDSDITFAEGNEMEARREQVAGDIDLLGRMLVRSRDLNAVLFYQHHDDLFVVDDVLGSPRSSLRVLRASLSRVPFEANDNLVWDDFLPTRSFVPWLLRPLMDFISPFLPRSGIAMRYRMLREGADFVVRGESTRWRRKGEPVVQTEAVLVRDGGIGRMMVSVRGKRREVRQVSGQPQVVEQGATEEAS